ncbi:MAG TPA: hypothetical protein VMU94_08825 [Streptosporangiaceae bacterium]|nr:hypothetical protein [Streptosporangiaceae bacterium]
MKLRTPPVAFLSLLAAAACAGPAAARDHGHVVAHLTIPFRPAAVTGKTEVIKVAVSSGQRFSVKVDTSDGPFFWNQTGSRPDPRVVRLAGDVNDGGCASGMVGCRVPYFHTLLARARGTTTMSWKYHDLRCQAVRKRMTQATRECPSVTVVTFYITVR